MHARFDPEPSDRYPNGYWYVKTEKGNYDADGSTPLNALAALIQVIEEEENL